jgi:hypothetical protein
MSATTEEPISRKYVSFTEAEAITSLSEDTLRRLVARRRLRVFKPSPRRVLLDLGELVQLIEGSEVQPPETAD